MKNFRTFTLESTFLSGITKGWGNGYVVIPHDSPLAKMDYTEIDDLLYSKRNIFIHGGLTFARKAEKLMLSKHWFKALKRADADIGDLVVGFDTAHLYDNDNNCPKKYVRNQTNKLRYHLERIKF